MMDLQEIKKRVIQGTYKSEKFDQTKVEMYRKKGRLVAQVWVKNEADQDWRRSFYFFPNIDTRLTGELVHYVAPHKERSVEFPKDPHPYGFGDNL